MRQVIWPRPHLACAQLIWRPGRIHPAHANGAPACMRCRGPAWSTSANSPIAPASWSAGAIGDPHALVVLPPVQDTRRSSGCPVLSRSLSCLWVVPVFAGREVLRLNSVPHKPLRGLISRFFCYPPGYPPNELTSPQNLKLSTSSSTAKERGGPSAARAPEPLGCADGEGVPTARSARVQRCGLGKGALGARALSGHGRALGKGALSARAQAPWAGRGSRQGRQRERPGVNPAIHLHIAVNQRAIPSEIGQTPPTNRAPPRPHDTSAPTAAEPRDLEDRDDVLGTDVG
jgi:hypothetical protein